MSLSTDSEEAAPLQPDLSELQLQQPFHLIQPYHVVLGDTSCRNQRTTTATQVLRQCKRDTRQRYFGKKTKAWLPLAVEDLERRLQTMDGKLKQQNEKMYYSCSFHNEYQGSLEPRFLIKCTPKALQSGRVAKNAQTPLYGFVGDIQPTYTVAQMPDALEFFFLSRDGRQLAADLVRHQENVELLLHQWQQARKRQQVHTPMPVPRCIQHFQETLRFFQLQVQRSEQEGGELATALLAALKPMNALKQQWKLVQQQVRKEEKQEVRSSSPNADTATTLSSTTTATSSGNKGAAGNPLKTLPDETQTILDKDDPLLHLDLSDIVLDMESDLSFADLELLDNAEKQQQQKRQHHQQQCFLWDDPPLFSKDLPDNVHTSRRRNRSDSDGDCTSLSDGDSHRSLSPNKSASKRSRTLRNTATAALATLATVLAVRAGISTTTSVPPLVQPWQSPESKGLGALQISWRGTQSHQRMLSAQDNDQGDDDDEEEEDYGEPLPWQDPLSVDGVNNKEEGRGIISDNNNNDAAWCQRESVNPFADIGEFLCSIDFTSHLGHTHQYAGRSEQDKDSLGW